MSKKYSLEHVIGEDDSYIDYASLSVPVHKDLVDPFLELHRRASSAGFELAIVSGFRSFERQLLIWNDKVAGRRPVYDSNGVQLDLSLLTPWQQVQSILRWSALPGASRHHWGSDIDVYDRSAVAADYSVQLTEQEADDDGPFGAMHCWLDQQIDQGDAEGFFRPYAYDRGGVAPERWHLSCAPVAEPYQDLLTPGSLERLVAARPLLLKEVVLSHLDEIFHRFVSVSYEE